MYALRGTSFIALQSILLVYSEIEVAFFVVFFLRDSRISSLLRHGMCSLVHRDATASSYISFEEMAGLGLQSYLLREPHASSGRVYFRWKPEREKETVGTYRTAARPRA